MTPAKCFAEMKDSGIEWISQIPPDWEVKRLKELFSFGKGLPITKADLVDSGVSVISYGQIHAKSNTGTHMAKSLLRYVPKTFLETNPSAILKKGDIVLADTSEDLNGLGNAVLMDIDDTVFAGYHTIILHPSDADFSKYLSYLFQTVNWRSQLRANASGIKVFSVTQKMLRSCNLILPPKSVRDAITAYLDTQCAKIDEIIAQAKASIEDYKQWKASIIYEAVTKGLDPNVEMKDSGIPCVDKVPKHWTVTRFGKIAAVKSNLVNPKDYQSYKQISPENIEKGSGVLLDYVTVEESGVISGNHLFYKGQILYSKIRPTLNKVIIAPFDGLCSADMYPIDTDHCSRFILYLMLSAYFNEQVALVTGNRVKMPKINQNELSQIMVAIPSDTEEQQIAKYLDLSCSQIDVLIKEKQSLIDDLESYKKSLIYEVVTGKRRV